VISCSKGSSQPAGLLLAEAFEAALMLVEFFPTPGVAHEPEAAGGVDLQAGPDAAKKGLAGGGFQFCSKGSLGIIFRIIPAIWGGGRMRKVIFYSEVYFPRAGAMC
jgi:hypothetical protein